MKTKAFRSGSGQSLPTEVSSAAMTINVESVFRHPYSSPPLRGRTATPPRTEKRDTRLTQETSLWKARRSPTTVGKSSEATSGSTSYVPDSSSSISNDCDEHLTGTETEVGRNFPSASDFSSLRNEVKSVVTSLDTAIISSPAPTTTSLRKLQEASTASFLAGPCTIEAKECSPAPCSKDMILNMEFGVKVPALDGDEHASADFSAVSLDCSQYRHIWKKMFLGEKEEETFKRMHLAVSYQLSYPSHADAGFWLQTVPTFYTVA